MRGDTLRDPSGGLKPGTVLNPVSKTAFHQHTDVCNVYSKWDSMRLRITRTEQLQQCVNKVQAAVASEIPECGYSPFFLSWWSGDGTMPTWWDEVRWMTQAWGPGAIYNLSIAYFWNFHLIFPDCGGPQVTETAGSENTDKEGLLHSNYWDIHYFLIHKVQ